MEEKPTCVLDRRRSFHLTTRRQLAQKRFYGVEPLCQAPLHVRQLGGLLQPPGGYFGFSLVPL